MRAPADSGFSLTELMVGVVVIGIIAAITIPAYRQYMRRSHQAECISNLADIRKAQVSYRDDPAMGLGHFAADIEALGWRTSKYQTIGNPPAYYTYGTNGSADSWAKTAHTDEVINPEIRMDIEGQVTY
jgi:type IV pilus assembly protein PilE